MTHYIKTVFSDNTICKKLVFQVLRSDNEDTSNVLNNINCPQCIIEIKDVIRKIENSMNLEKSS